MGIVFEVKRMDDPVGISLFVEDVDAIAILHDLLNYGSQEKIWNEPGTLNPADVLIRLSMADFRIEQMIHPIFEYVDSKANACPPEASLRLYVERLTELAEKALDVDEEIVFKTP